MARREHAGCASPQAARRSRPLRRREARIERPARVRIRRRKPWVLWRRRLLGWKVRLLMLITPLRGRAEDRIGTGSARARHASWTGSQLAPLAHATCPESEAVVDVRHRSTPVRPPNGTGSPAAGSNQRVGAPGHPRTTCWAAHGEPREDTPGSVHSPFQTCGGPVDPRGGRLLPSSIPAILPEPGSPRRRTAGPVPSSDVVLAGQRVFRGVVEVVGGPGRTTGPTRSPHGCASPCTTCGQRCG